MIDELSFEVPKTKDAIELMRSVEINGSVLLVVDGHDQNVERSFRNIPRIHLITVDQLNTYDVLARDWIVFTRAALDKVNTRAPQGGSNDEAKAEAPVVQAETPREATEEIRSEGGETP